VQTGPEGGLLRRLAGCGIDGRGGAQPVSVFGRCASGPRGNDGLGGAYAALRLAGEIPREGFVLAPHRHAGRQPPDRADLPVCASSDDSRTRSRESGLHAELVDDVAPGFDGPRFAFGELHDQGVGAFEQAALLGIGESA
jgi:hypothetical protein